MGLFGSDKHHFHTNTKTELVPYEKTVHEHKAPTDDSIKLLNEFEEKAKHNIIAKIRTEDNLFKAVGIYYIVPPDLDTVEYHIRFTLNGKEIIIKEKISAWEWQQEKHEAWKQFGNEGILRVAYKKFAEVIAAELLRQSPEFVKSLKQ